MKHLLPALCCATLALTCGKKNEPTAEKRPATKEQAPPRLVPKTINVCGKRLVIASTQKVYCRGWGAIQASTLSGFAKLRLLDVSSSLRLEGVKHLAALPALRTLTLFRTEVDSAQLATLVQLRELKIIKAPYAKDLTPLAVLTGLTYLRCSHCAVTEVAFLAKMPQLEALSLSHSPSIKSFAPIGGLGKLRFLNLSGTGVSDLSWISGLKKLEKLMLAGTKIKQVKHLAQLTSLRELNLASTRVRDISALPKLKNLDRLNLQGNPQLRRLSPLRKMSWLKTLTVTAKAFSKRQLARLQKALPRTKIRAR